MNTNPPDDLDRVIDEALSSMMNETPRRVSAASVRQALEPRRRSALPMWLAVAAVLIAGFVVSLRKPNVVTEAPNVAVATSPAPIPSLELSPRPDSSVPVQQTSGRVVRTSRRVGSEAIDNELEGLPRLSIASLGRPDPLLAPARIEVDRLQIPRLEIEPLSVVALSSDPEINPPTK
jgi:hypothetical protein